MPTTESPILAMQSSGAELGFALQSDRGYREIRAGTGLRHGREALPLLDELLRACGCSPAEIGLVIVDQGPGSFTGLRISLSIARGLQAVSPALGISGVSGLEVSVFGLSAGLNALAVIDGRKQRYFCLQATAGSSFPAPPADRILDLRAHEIAETWGAEPMLVTGTGAGALMEELSRSGKGAPEQWRRDPRAAEPSLRLLLELGRRRAADGHLLGDSEGPLYARASQAEESPESRSAGV